MFSFLADTIIPLFIPSLVLVPEILIVSNSDSITPPGRSFVHPLFTQHVEQFNKQIQPLTTLWTDSFTQLPNIMQTAVKQLSERTIQVKIDGEPNPRYTTEISNTGDIINNFPKEVPGPTDVYWTRHNQLVDRYLSDDWQGDRDHWGNNKGYTEPN